MKSTKLVLADVDGTLVTQAKVLTERTRRVVRKLGEAGVAFAITSGRPPRGNGDACSTIENHDTDRGINGGLLVGPDLSLIQQRVLQPPVVGPVIDIIKAHTLDVWIYRAPIGLCMSDTVRIWTVKFSPTVVPDFTGKMNDVAKIVGVSDDLDAISKCEQAVRKRFENDVGCGQSNPQREPASQVSAARSQPYYLRDASRREQRRGRAELGENAWHSSGRNRHDWRYA